MPLTVGLTLGLALAMDAYCVSLADVLANPDMGRKKMILIALVFGLFQTAMPLLGRFSILFVSNTMAAVKPYVKYAAAAVFAFLAVRMLISGIGNAEEEAAAGIAAILVQGVATSIDALSAGFEFYSRSLSESLFISLIIGAVTFVLCLIAMLAGRKAGGLAPRIARFAGAAIFVFLCLRHLGVL